MQLGMEVGLGPGDFVFAGDPGAPKKNGTPIQSIFCPYLLWPNGWMDEVATWYGGKPRPSRRSVRWGRSSSQGHNPHFSVHVYCGKTAGWMKTPLSTVVDLGPGTLY